MKRKAKQPLFDPKVFLSKVNGGRAISDYRKDEIAYRQGDPADSVFYIQSGKVKTTVISEQGARKPWSQSSVQTNSSVKEACRDNHAEALSHRKARFDPLVEDVRPPSPVATQEADRFAYVGNNQTSPKSRKSLKPKSRAFGKTLAPSSSPLKRREWRWCSRTQRNRTIRSSLPMTAFFL